MQHIRRIAAGTTAVVAALALSTAAVAQDPGSPTTTSTSTSTSTSTPSTSTSTSTSTSSSTTTSSTTTMVPTPPPFDVPVATVDLPPLPRVAGHDLSLLDAPSKEGLELIQLTATMDRLDRRLERHQQAIAAAMLRRADALNDLREHTAKELVLAKMVSALRTRVRNRAVASYVQGASTDEINALLDPTSAEADQISIMVQSLARTDQELVWNLRAHRQLLTMAHRSKERAKRRADRQAERLESGRQALTKARDELQGKADVLRALVEERDRREAELQLQLEAYLREVAARTAEAPPAMPASLQAAIGQGAVSVGGGGLALCDVGGIRVNCGVAAQVAKMVMAARAEGLVLSGGGYRNSAMQIRLRAAHCGPTPADIYLKPSSQCSPPTARPGSSQHEVGLAIDFNNCSTRATPCFQWLAKNARRFGYYNLPSEPWHWSTTGR